MDVDWALSCKWLIRVFEDLWQNIQINGQYANCDSIKAFINVLLRSKIKYVQTLANALIFLQLFCIVSECIHQISSFNQW